MKGNKDCAICKVVGVLVGIGALNWGLVAFFQFNLVDQLLGSMTAASKAVYGAIGVAGALKLASLVKGCPCQKGCESK